MGVELQLKTNIDSSDKLVDITWEIRPRRDGSGALRFNTGWQQQVEKGEAYAELVQATLPQQATSCPDAWRQRSLATLPQQATSARRSALRGRGAPWWGCTSELCFLGAPRSSVSSELCEMATRGSG